MTFRESIGAHPNRKGRRGRPLLLAARLRVCAMRGVAPPRGGGELHLLRFLLGFLGHLSSLANVDAQFDADERRLSYAARSRQQNSCNSLTFRTIRSNMNRCSARFDRAGPRATTAPCPTTRSATCSGSRPLAKAMVRRSAASSMAVRRAFRWPPPRSSAISTAAVPDSRASPPSAASPTRCASCPACSRDDDGEEVTTGTPIALLIDNVDQRSKDYSDIRTSIGRDTPTTSMMSNTASATIAAADGRRRAKPRRGSRLAQSPARSCRACGCAAR